ncbi:Glycerol-3-phosphate dehydrogenase [NAD(P)+] [Geodia barretti]|uniref:Glycerol-3-phosphate dehydrogenase [NAD(P)+] n=1 Tax=Geodia barretti TaxID=519541 RepID=A0AA35R033_GEOBA|nr:Glycerol-3-phosphate dehydrogenase [NAD(P)+] [Geodia barretti]
MMFPDSMSVHHEPRRALSNTDCVIIAVPSVAMREVIEAHVAEIAPDSIVVSATKGLEIESGKRMSEIIAECISARHSLSVEEAMTNICALSGPNLSVEIAIGLPALATAASVSIETAERVQMMTSGERFRVYASDDIIGGGVGWNVEEHHCDWGGIHRRVGFRIEFEGGLCDARVTRDNALGISSRRKTNYICRTEWRGRHAYDLLQPFEQELSAGHATGGG